MRNIRRTGVFRVLTVAAALTLPLALTPTAAQADPAPSASQKKLIDSITAPAVKKHLEPADKGIWCWGSRQETAGVWSFWGR